MTTPTTENSVRAIEAQGVTRRFKNTLALDNVTLNFDKDKIHGLLGRNGAGKTTLMSVMTAQDWPSEGEVRVFGQVPHENEQVLPDICFVREDQRYPEDALAKHAFAAARDAFENWDEDFARQLIQEFRVPEKTSIKKMSRGQKSAVGVIIGLASRAPLTVFDEPYMGLDAVARQLFYDRLLQDYSENPRTIVLSSHLIDEIAHLLEHVVVIVGYGKEDDAGINLLESHLAQNLEPTHARHVQIKQNQVRLEFVGKADGVHAIAGFPGRIEIRLHGQQVTQTAAHHGVVVH